MLQEDVMSRPIPSMESAHDQLKDNNVIIVLGASGDLAKKKTFPALFALYRQGSLPHGCKIVGYARTKMDQAEFEKRATSYIKGVDENTTIESFRKCLSYVSGNYEGDLDNLNTHIKEIESKYNDQSKKANRIFYIALPPTLVLTVSKNLKEHCYNTKGGYHKIIVEKPFGSDLDSATKLLSSIKQYWTEEETFRIDHYLGKEMVKNIFALRFANVAMGAAWDKNSISNVQITFEEPFGTEGRGGFFDGFGIIRDVLQNHLLQVLSVLTMERPASFSAEDIRDAKVKVLRCIPPVERRDTLLGQYVAANGKPGYLDDTTVPSGSVSPTFAATTLWIHNARWEGVPFILKAGKALNKNKVEVRIQFKDVTQGIFDTTARNELVISLRPSEAVYLKLNSKLPGLHPGAISKEMDITYHKRSSDAKIPEAYEALILDVLRGDHSNFVRHDELVAAWEIFTPILHWIDGQDGPKPRPVPYPYGSRGPNELQAFMERYGYKEDPRFYPAVELA